MEPRKKHTKILGDLLEEALPSLLAHTIADEITCTIEEMIDAHHKETLRLKGGGAVAFPEVGEALRVELQNVTDKRAGLDKLALKGPAGKSIFIPVAMARALDAGTWVAIPHVLTSKMHEAFFMTENNFPWRPNKAYEKMLAAAPKTPDPKDFE